MNSWDQLFGTINEALQLATMLIECVHPDVASQYYKLSEVLKADQKKHGEFLWVNECSLPGVAVYFNMQPGIEDFHMDKMSMFQGWESFHVI